MNLRKAIQLILGVFLLASCQEVRYKNAQPKEVKSLDQMPTELIGSYYDEVLDKYLIVKPKSFKYVKFSDETYNTQGNLDDGTAVIKEYNGKYWLSVPVKTQKELWYAGCFELNDDYLTAKLIHTESGLNTFRSLTEYTDNKDKTVITVDPTKEELLSALNSGAFTQVASFSKVGEGDMENFFIERYKKKQKEKEAKIENLKNNFCLELDSMMQLSEEDYQAMGYSVKRFLGVFKTNNSIYSKYYTIKLKEKSIGSVDLFDWDGLNEKLISCGYRLTRDSDEDSYLKFKSYRKYGTQLKVIEGKNSLDLEIYWSKTLKVNCLSGDCINGKGKAQYNNGQYTGYFKNGLRHGTGEYAFTDGNMIKGNYIKGIIQGPGKIFYPSGKLLYDGSFLDGKKSGDGLIYYENGKLKFDGTYKDGDANGKGILHYTDDWRYEGNFETNFESGYGRLFDDKGILRYEGNFKKGLKSGFGTYYYVDGFIYTGEWLEGKRNGQGKLSNAETGKTYEGTFKDDKFIDPANSESKCLTGDCVNGYGKMAFDGGTLYEGFFKDGQEEGPGMYTYSNGNVSIGNFKNQTLTGFGIYKWTNLREVYIGEFLNFKQNGLGSYFGSDTFISAGVLVNNKYSIKYSFKESGDELGCLRGDCKNSFGEFKWENGVRFQGFFKDGLTYKFGKYIFENGAVYIGEISGATKEGFGYFIWPNGAYYIGEYKDDKIHGRGMYIVPSDPSKNLIGEFANGRIVKKMD